MQRAAQLYQWEGVTPEGERVTGQAQGRSPAFVTAGLKQRGIRVARVRPATRCRGPIFVGRMRVDPAGFSRQLATLLKAGVPLLQAFEVMTRSATEPTWLTLLTTLKHDIGAGLSLARALQKHPRWFDPLYCNLVRVGEESGTLERQLGLLADMLERREALKRKLRKAMAYPLLLLLTGLGVSALLLLEVVPRFEHLFGSADKSLPAFTQWVIDLSNGLARYGVLIAVAMAVVAYAAVHLCRRKLEARLWLMRQLLRLPTFGPLLSHGAQARFARSLATAYGAGVALLDALNSVAAVSGDPLHEGAIRRLHPALANGSTLHQALSREPVFSPMLVQLCAIGEASGTLEIMLDKAAQHYESQVETGLEQMTTLIEPAIVLTLGVLVGGLVVAMYLPIFQLGSLV